ARASRARLLLRALQSVALPLAGRVSLLARRRDRQAWAPNHPRCRKTGFPYAVADEAEKEARFDRTLVSCFLHENPGKQAAGRPQVKAPRLTEPENHFE